MVCQELEVIRNADANETSGKLHYAFDGALVGVPVKGTIIRFVY